MRAIIIGLLRGLFGFLFIFSAVSKMLSIGVFEISIIEQGLFREREWAAVMARILIGYELFLGTAFFVRYGLKKIILPLTLLTLAGFTIYLAYFALFRPEMTDCGCFGETLPLTPLESIGKNIVILALVLLLYRLAPEYPIKWKFHSILLALVIAGTFVLIPVQKVKVTLFSKYTTFHNSGIVDMHSGKKIVAVFNVDCEHCLQTAFELGLLYKNDNRLPPLYGLIAGDSIKVPAFFEKAAFRFPYRMISDEEFFNLIGNQPPRLYHLVNGEIVHTWDDRFTEQIRQVYPE